MLKAVLLDFDGTLVIKDILDIACSIVGKEEESKQLNKIFHSGNLPGLTALITRINFLKGVTIKQIVNKLNEKNYLIQGSDEFFVYLKKHKIISIIHSGNIIPILEYYQNLLRADYIVGTQPKMDGDTIIGITENDFQGKNFKVNEVKAILNKLSIKSDETLAIGDSPADLKMFEFSGKSIAINPKGGIEKYTNFVIEDSLLNAIPLINKIYSN